LSTFLLTELLQIVDETKRRHSEIKEFSIKTIIKILNDLVFQGVEVQLKILQTIPPLINNYQSLQGDLLIDALLICFRIQDSKAVVVSNTAAATLRQLVINIFEKILLEDEINDKVISMEIFHGICMDGALLRTVYYSYDKQNHSTNVYKEMISAFGRLATEKPQTLGKSGNSLNGNSCQSIEDDGLTNIGGGLNPPQIPETYLYYLTLLCLNSIVDGLHDFVIKNLTNVIQYQKKSTLQSKSQILVADMANTSWPGLLAALSFFLSTNLDEDLFHNVLRAYQNFTIVCGFLHLSTPRDAFITCLCKSVIPHITMPPMLPSENNACETE
ncbi:6919_t:CDS:2, partial [Racocetra fulgida]